MIFMSDKAVRPFDDQVDNKIGKNHPHKPDNRKIGGLAGPPSHGQPPMEHQEVKKPGDHRENPLRVPGPIVAGHVPGPERPCEDSESQERTSRHDRPLVHLVQKIERRELVIEPAKMFRLEKALLNQIHHSRGEGYGKSHSSKDNHCGMYPEPAAVERKLLALLAPRKKGCRAQKKECQGENKRTKDMDPVFEIEKKMGGDHAPREKRERLRKIGYGKMSGLKRA